VVELKMKVIDERRKLLEESDVDLLRTLVKQVVEALFGQQQSGTRGMARHCERTWLTAMMNIL